MPESALPVADRALARLGRYLLEKGYQFITVTPATHGAALRRSERKSPASLRDIFGWNRCFFAEDLESDALQLLQEAGALETTAQTGAFKSRYRFSTAHGQIYAHSSFPTNSEDSVFFGPDTYRFMRFARANSGGRCRRALDLGCGSGAGGLSIADFCDEELVLSDINDQALRLSRINWTIHARPTASMPNIRAGAWPKVTVKKSDLFEQLEGGFDLILANPPFMADPLGRFYRDGGGNLGSGLTERLIRESFQRLNPAGRFILYSGSPIQDGHDPVRRFAETQMRPGFRMHYSEIDPDIFGDELNQPVYADVERISAVGLVIIRDEISGRKQTRQEGVAN